MIFCKGELKSLNQKYEVLALSSPGEDLVEVSRREGVRVIAVPMKRRISLLCDLIALFRLTVVIANEKPYMVHSMTPKAGLLCMIAAWLNRVPVRVHTFTGLVFPTTIGVMCRILMITDTITCFCATHVIPEGEGVKKDLIDHHITEKPMRVLGYGNGRGVDLEYYSKRPEVMEIVKKQLSNSQSVFNFLFVGRVVGDKGINELCRAFEQIHKQFPKTKLWLVGAFEDNIDPIKAETKYSINDPLSGVEAVGVKQGEELLAYYAAADCFVMPSYREGFPNTVLEVGAMGLPSIVTDINGSREIIVEGKNGTIVPPKSEQALFDAMRKMISNEKWRENMNSNARRMIAERFEQEYVRKCLYDFYSEILEGNKGANSKN